jgi:putative pyruvate formate lyase activating enzyme
MSIVLGTLLTKDEWSAKIAQADAYAASCCLCPRNCGVNRLTGERGFCNAPHGLVISSAFAHHGEEPPLSGTNGSGTIFFSHCTLGCAFCQNWQISHSGEGKAWTPRELANRMLELQNEGCHNVNLVTASHFLPWILRALEIAFRDGLSIPIVYNSSGYESTDVITLLSGVVDIWLPDMKYGTNEPALSYSQAADYVEVNQKAIRAMFRQVGSLKTTSDDIATRGLCIRHLVLPGGLAGSLTILDFLLNTFDPADIFVSLMAQYRPLHKALNDSLLNRRVLPEEYETVKKQFLDAGFAGFFQEYELLDTGFVIDFSKRKTERLTGN